MLNSSTTLSLFQQVARENPESLAIVFEDQELTFVQLEQMSEQIATALQDKGVQRGDCVGLSIERRPEAIASMFAAFKVGAAFVPLDPEYPPDRLQFMIEDAEIRVVVTHDKPCNPIAEAIDQKLDVSWLDCEDIDFCENTVLGDNAALLAPDDLAYIMYTSGSTGMPKGVQIEHSALLTYCLADIEVYKLKADDRTLQFSTLNFDIAIEEIFPPLLIGSCVVIRPRERSTAMNELSEIVERFDVTAIHMATAYWHEWVDLMVGSQSSVPESLRLVIATGEKVSTEHYRRWLKLCRHDVLWCNAYGPTEATVTATVYIPPPGFDQPDMPIGHPLPGYDAYLLDDEKNLIQEPGVTGNLYIAGPALARGYLNREDLTVEAFQEVDIEGRMTRGYRTGDLARWLPDGEIEFAGRIDHQIKLGSYRIEPGEIEATINRHTSVLESLVVYEQIGAQKFLLAYVATGKKTMNVECLSGFLRDELPSYMVPTRYIFVPHFPKTINGKVDRRNLPPPSEAETAQDQDFAAPRNAMETQLSALWARVLNLPRVGVFDDFFALGGSSLLVTRVVSELKRDLDLELPVRDFFANPTVATSARHILRMLGEEVAAVDDEELQRARESQPLVLPSFIGCTGRELFSVRYQPAERVGGESRQHAVLICQPVGHEHTRAYRNLQQLGLMLATQGFDVLRFDYFGTGNSNGECGEFRLESMQADIRKAADCLMVASQAEKLSLLGVRVGATLAANMTTEGKMEYPIEKLIAWDPIADGNVFLSTLARLNEYALSSQTRFVQVEETREGEIFGHEWPQEKIASMKRLQFPAAEDSQAMESTLLLSRDYLEMRPKLKSLSETWNVVQCHDEIYWEDPQFTESAFASPSANRAIVEFLTKG